MCHGFRLKKKGVFINLRHRLNFNTLMGNAKTFRLICAEINLEKGGCLCLPLKPIVSLSRLEKMRRYASDFVRKAEFWHVYTLYIMESNMSIILHN